MKNKLPKLLLIGTLVVFSNDSRAQSHFNQCVSATGTNASVIIEPSASPTMDNLAMEPGDEIAVYTGAGLCAGAEVWTGSVIAVTVWGDDTFTSAIDGMQANEAMRFVMWDKSTGEEFGLVAGSSVTTGLDNNPPYRGTATFVGDAIFRVTSMVGEGAPNPNELPIAVIQATPTTGTAPLTVSFNGTNSSDPDGQVVSYAWDFGDGGTATGSSLQHVYSSAGPYTARLTVTDNQGGTNSTTVVITVAAANQPPNASFAATPTSGIGPLNVNFNASQSSDPDGSIVSYTWTYGDGASGTGVTASHTYANAGTYTARLTVRDNANATSTASRTITVSAPNTAPVAVATGSPLSGTAPLTVSFNGNGSSDSDGSIQTYSWNFGDGSTANGSTIQHVFTSAGTYDTRLTVTDDDGASSFDVVQVVVQAANQKPTASFSANPLTGAAPLLVSVDASASSDSDGTIASYSWNFGDGSNASGATTSHTYTTPGTYSLALTVVDDDGASASMTRTITVTGAGNVAPVAAIAATPLSGTAPLNVSFNGGGSTDSDGSIASYNWTFGDGSNATGVTTQHTYSNAGSYTATLRVTDNNGASGSQTVQIVVSAPQNTPPSASFVAAPTTGTAPLLVTLNANQSSDGDGSIVSYSWSFGDGANGSGKNTVHTFSQPGTYVLALTVTDDDGASDTDSQTIVVNAGANEQPSANFTATPLTGTAPLLVNMDASASTDSDGDVVSYAWSFGDGASGSGETTSHTYTSPGSYSLRLTVTDDDGAVNSKVATIVVTGAGNRSPVAEFVASPTSGNAPLQVALNANQSSDPDGSIASYSWDFGNGVTGSGKNTSHTYLTAGSFTLTLTVTDNGGAVATKSTTINVNNANNASPVASFSATPVTGTAPLRVALDASASSDPDGTIGSYSWRFGDGVQGSGRTTSHTFVAPGNYTIELTVTDDRGGTATSSRVVQVTSDIGVQSDLVLRLTLDEVSGSSLTDESGKGQQSTLMNGATFDETGGIEGGAVIFDGVDDYIDVADNVSWNLTDITHRTISLWFKVTDKFVSTRKQVIYEQGGTTRGLAIYIDNGTLYVGGWNAVQSESNWNGTYLQTGSVQSGRWHHVALVLDGRFTTVQDDRLIGYLDGARFGSGPASQVWPHGDDTGIGAVDGDVRFHDGAVSGGGYNAFGGSIDEIRIYDAILNEEEVRALASFSGQTANSAPTAVFGLNPSTAQVPANITFNASGSADGDGSIVIYSWDYGDSNTGSGKISAHAYQEPGTYDITLTVTDDDGATHSTTGTVVVTAADGNAAPVATFSAIPVSGEPRSVRFDASDSSDPDGTLEQFIWDFGDGESVVGQVVTHDYAVGGAYVVKLTVVDNSGATTVEQQTVEVDAAFPSALQPSTIGPVAAGGGVSFSDDQWLLSVPGTTWDPRVDAMLFVHRPVNNDVQTVVRVDSVAQEDSVMYAGIGIRSGLTPTDANAIISTRGGRDVVFTYRAARGGWEIETVPIPVTLPVWLRVSRSGDVVTGAYSQDGETWSQVSQQTIPSMDGVYAGLSARTSDRNRIASVRMSEFSVAVDEEIVVELPDGFQLSQAFPNPFSETTQFTLTLEEQEDIHIAAFDISGRRVAVLQNGPMAPDTAHRIFFDGSRLASGLYLIRIHGESFAETRKVIVIR